MSNNPQGKVIVERNKIEKNPQAIPADKDMIVKDGKETFTVPGKTYRLNMKDDEGKPVPDYVIDILLRDYGAFPEVLENGQVKQGKVKIRNAVDPRTGEQVGVVEEQRYQYKNQQEIDNAIKESKERRARNRMLPNVNKPDDLVQVRARTIEKKYVNMLRALRQKLGISIE